VKFSSLNASH